MGDRQAIPGVVQFLYEDPHLYLSSLTVHQGKTMILSNQLTNI